MNQIRREKDEAREPLNYNDDSSSEREESGWTDKPARRHPQMRTVFHWALHTVSFLVIAALIMNSRYVAERARQAEFNNNYLYTPLLDVVPRKMSTEQLIGTFRAPSPYKGPPSPEVDAAWSRIVDFEFVNVSRAEMVKMGRTLDSAQFPDDMGGGYLGLFESGHHLHCLRSLWEDHHFDKSAHAQSFKAEMPDVYELHYEHCVDVLRQRLMCTADANVITYEWVEGIEAPYPNFNTQHRCGNFDELLDWVVDNQVAFPKGYVFRAPPGAVQRKEPI